MATKWGNHEKDYKDLASSISKYSAKAVKDQVDKLVEEYKKCEKLQDFLPAMLSKARSEGIEGSSLDDFKKNKGFYDAYKALDKQVDALWKEQVKAKQMSNEARQTVNDLKTLQVHIATDMGVHEKELKEVQADLKDNQAKAKSGKATLSPATIKAADATEKDFKKNSGDIEKLSKQIAADIKDLTEAGGMYKGAVDQKMENYAAKFEKTIEKTLDLAPKSVANEEGLPKELQEKVLGVAVKKAVADAKQLEKHCGYAMEKAETDKKAAAPELKAAQAKLNLLKKVKKEQDNNRKKFKLMIQKAKSVKELERSFKLIDEAFETSEKTYVKTVKDIGAMK